MSLSLEFPNPTNPAAALGEVDAMVYAHVPVLLNEVVRLLDPRPGETVLDCTVGGGGHAAALLAAVAPSGRLIGLDRDPQALEYASRQLAPYAGRVRLIHTNFDHLASVLARVEVPAVDRILFDVGVSSPQLDDPGRGFSYRADKPLDMRMDPGQSTSAYHLVNGLAEGELADIIRRFGEERWAARIAHFIVEARSREDLATTGQLADVVKRAIPAAARRHGGHPARRTFQALRIAVNHELDALEAGLDQALAHLRPGGRLAVISFHSLEDRIVKRRFRDWAKDCSCPPDMPVCGCGGKPLARAVTRKPATATPEETAANPRARSARLRVVERTDHDMPPRALPGTGSF